MNMNKLVDGKIPAGQACPFKDSCPCHGKSCYHKGVDHPTPFSCAYARAFYMFGTDRQVTYPK